MRFNTQSPMRRTHARGRTTRPMASWSRLVNAVALACGSTANDALDHRDGSNSDKPMVNMGARGRELGANNLNWARENGLPPLTGAGHAVLGR